MPAAYYSVRCTSTLFFNCTHLPFATNYYLEDTAIRVDTHGLINRYEVVRMPYILFYLVVDSISRATHVEYMREAELLLLLLLLLVRSASNTA